MGPGWVKNGREGYFHTSHSTPNQVFPKNKVLSSSPDTKEEIFRVGLVSFDQSGEAINLPWYRMLLFFLEFASITPFMA